MPYRGRYGRIDNTRELVIPRLPYRGSGSNSAKIYSSVLYARSTPREQPPYGFAERV